MSFVEIVRQNSFLNIPYNLAYRRRSYKGAGAYIRIKAPRRLYPALFFKYQISYIDSEK